MHLRFRASEVAIFGALFLVGCDRANAEPSAPETQIEELSWADGGLKEPGQRFDRVASWSTAVPRVRACSDGQIAAILDASDQAEIDVATAVVKRVEDPAVRALAERLIADHTKAKDELIALLARTGLEPVENDNSKEISDAADQEVAALSSKTGDELESGFVSHEVLDHLQDLGTIDHLLLPSVQNRELAGYIHRVRSTIARHEVLSSEVQSSLVGSCGGESEAMPDASLQ